MRLALIQSNTVKNVVEGDLQTVAFLFPSALVVASDSCSVGWTYNSITGVFSPPVESQQAVEARLIRAVQTYLDTTAETRNYDGILSLCSYASSTDPKFGVEGRAGLAWRDACWAHCYKVMSDVQAGLRPVPTEAQLVAELPVMTWV